MSANKQELEAAVVVAAAVESTPDAQVAVEDQPVETLSAGPSVEAEMMANTQPTPAEQPGLRFLAAFGDQGGVWFARGLSWEEASEQYLESLKQDNERLRQQLTAMQAVGGEAEPVTFSEHTPPRKPKPLVRIAGKRYE